MFYVVYQGRQPTLVLGRDPAFDLFRIESCILPGNRDYRDVDVGKDVCWRTTDHYRAEDQNQQRVHDKRIGPVERNSDYPHTRSPDIGPKDITTPLGFVPKPIIKPAIRITGITNTKPVPFVLEITG